MLKGYEFMQAFFMIWVFKTASDFNHFYPLLIHQFTISMWETKYVVLKLIISKSAPASTAALRSQCLNLPHFMEAM